MASRDEGEPAFSFCRVFIQESLKTQIIPQRVPNRISQHAFAAIHRWPRRVDESVIIPVRFRRKRAGRLEKVVYAKDTNWPFQIPNQTPKISRSKH